MEPRYVLTVPVDVVHVQAEVAFLVVQSLGRSGGVPLICLYFFIEHLFSLFQGLFALELVELLQRFLGEIYFALLVTFNLHQNVLVLALRVEVEGPHHLFEGINVQDLVALATGKRQSFVQKYLECVLLVLKDFGGLQVLLRHIRLRNVGGLVASDQI